MDYSKLGIGTVQMGVQYGVNNQIGVPSDEEIKKIFLYANRAGINTLDTAINYGNSEERIGQLSVFDFKIVTKLPGSTSGQLYDSALMTKMLKRSLQLLKVEKLYGILLHSPMDLMRAGGNEIYNTLLRFKAEGIVEKIGISIYDPSELDMLLRNFSFDIVQAPFNLIDRRLYNSGWLQKLHKLGIEIHTRSVFLQGLLLMEPKNRPAKFQRWDHLWVKYREWLDDNNLTPLEACIRYATSLPEIQKVIIGIESEQQLQMILQAMEGGYLDLPAELQTEDSELLNPSAWLKY